MINRINLQCGFSPLLRPVFRLLIPFFCNFIELQIRERRPDHFFREEHPTRDSNISFKGI